MGRTLANISRALSSYGRQSAGIHRSTARNVNWHQMRAADARARGIAQRGRNLSSMVSGLGQMVGQQMIQAPIRERQQEMQDLSLQQGKAGLKVQEEQLSQLKEARERRRKYIEIISENSGIFEKAIPRLREAGLHDEADSQLEKALGIQKLMASLSQTEKKEHLTNLRLIAESVGTIANAPDEERAGKVVAGKLYLKNVVGENPLIDELLPDNPTDGDYEEMRDFYTVTLDAEKIAARKDADLARAIKTQTLSDAQAKSDDEMMENALTHLNAISEKGFGTARKWQRGKLPESLRSQFDQLVGGSQAEARESIQAYLGIESPARSGTLGELDEARKEEPGLTLFQLLERKQTIRTPPEEEKDLNPAQALAKSTLPFQCCGKEEERRRIF